ncbi:MAG: hypothetical protein JWO59_279, partial [Chloroflexi bacterium]|nr:hypothetical protein [Chloroflexota bacterium]
MTALDERMYTQWRLALTVILTLLAGGLLAALLYLTAARFGDLISLYFEAWVVQFVLAPAVDFLCKHHWRRAPAAGAVYLGTLVLVAGILIWIVPLFVVPLEDLARRLLA